LTNQDWVCGIDAGSFNTVNHVAWLQGKDFYLDLYKPSETAPLPVPPSIVKTPVNVYAVDAPQGLPNTGRRRRLCDQEANTPTRVLPNNRAELENWILYRGLIELGVKTFWWAYQSGEYGIFGLSEKLTMPIVAETYPRKTIEALEIKLRDIPSKRKAPFAYVKVVWDRLKEAGYRCNSVIHPTVDQVDAMLCAIAGQFLLSGSFIKLGKKPMVDEIDHVIREGFIIIPSFNGLQTSKGPG
jgi:predicted nuclease with RNAse H fold